MGDANIVAQNSESACPDPVGAVSQVSKPATLANPESFRGRLGSLRYMEFSSSEHIRTYADNFTKFALICFDLV